MNKVDKLINKIIKQGTLHSPRIIEAFRNVDRRDFVPKEYLKSSYKNSPLPIGYNQTISQPATVAFMLELLEPHEGDTILDVGFGSGWQSALLAHIVGSKGHVLAIELIPELKEFGEKNIEKYGFIKSGVVECLGMSAQNGLPEKAPFDKIIAAASARAVPSAWKEQLKIGGRMVVPIEESIFLIIKKSEDEFEEKEFPDFLFVPFIEN